MAKLAFILVGLVLFGLGAALAGGILQVAPSANSVKVYEFRPSADFLSSANDFSIRPVDGFTPSGNGATSGVSVLVWTAIRDTTQKWILNYEVSCSGLPAVISKGAAIVNAYLGSPDATIWVTLPMASRFGNLTTGRACTTLMFTTTPDSTYRFDGLLWVADSIRTTDRGLTVWVEAAGAGAGGDVEPGGAPSIPPAETEPGSGAAPPPPPKSAFGLPQNLLLGIALIGVGAVVIGIAVRR